MIHLNAKIFLLTTLSNALWVSFPSLVHSINRLLLIKHLFNKVTFNFSSFVNYLSLEILRSPPTPLQHHILLFLHISEKSPQTLYPVGWRVCRQVKVMVMVFVVWQDSVTFSELLPFIPGTSWLLLARRLFSGLVPKPPRLYTVHTPIWSVDGRTRTKYHYRCQVLKVIIINRYKMLELDNVQLIFI